MHHYPTELRSRRMSRESVRALSLRGCESGHGSAIRVTCEYSRWRAPYGHARPARYVQPDQETKWALDPALTDLPLAALPISLTRRV